MVLTSHLLTSTLCLITVIATASGATSLFHSPNSHQEAKTIDGQSPCCSVSQCKEIPLETDSHTVFQCYKTQVCGQECLTQKPLPPVPRYRRKNFYLKKFCQGSDCYDYAFDCRKCPDPSKTQFDPYSIDADCINCYYG